MIRRSKNNVETLYRSSWQHPLDNMNLTGGTNLVLADNYCRELKHTLGRRNLDGIRILDFGGGRGDMAISLQDSGANVVVADLYSFEYLKERGLTAVSSLKELPRSDKYDGAIAVDVVEHLTTPWDDLIEIRKLLKAGGWLYLSTPNAQSLNARLFREKWREAINPSHLILFTPLSIEIALEKAGFQRHGRLVWQVDYSENKLIQAKDWFLRKLRLDGVLRYLAFA